MGQLPTVFSSCLDFDFHIWYNARYEERFKHTLVPSIRERHSEADNGASKENLVYDKGWSDNPMDNGYSRNYTHVEADNDNMLIKDKKD